MKPKIIALLWIFLIPLLVTYFFVQSVTFKNFSPLDDGFNSLQDHFLENAWVFSFLNIAGDFPFYRVEPNPSEAGPAIIVDYKRFGVPFTSYVPFDSLSFLQNKLEKVNQETILNLEKIDWSDCQFRKDFFGGFTSTNEYKAKIDISVSLVGLFFIFITLFTIWNGLLLLFFNTYKTILDFKF